MAVRIHYRHGLLHSSKDRHKKKNTFPDIRSKLERRWHRHRLNTHHQPIQWLTDWHMAPVYSPLSLFADWQHTCDSAEFIDWFFFPFEWLRQWQCPIYKTCNSRHFPDARGALWTINNKHVVPNAMHWLCTHTDVWCISTMFVFSSFLLSVQLKNLCLRHDLIGCTSSRPQTLAGTLLLLRDVFAVSEPAQCDFLFFFFFFKDRRRGNSGTVLVLYISRQRSPS